MKPGISGFESVWACFDPQARDIIYFRPLISLFNLFLFNLSAGEVVFYRWMTLVLFTGFLFILYTLTQKLFQKQLVAIVTVVLFCAHPINAFYVNHLSASANLIWGILFLGVLVAHVNYLQTQKQVYKWASYFITLLALLAHEMTVILPGFIFLLEIYERKSWQESLKEALKYGLMMGVFYVVRSLVVPSSAGVWSMIKTGGEVLGLNIGNYLASLGVLLGWFLQQMVWPSNILFMKTILPIKHNVEVVLGVMGVVTAVAGILLVAIKEVKWKFIVIWFLFGLVPFGMASLIYPFEGITIEPHWLMIASFSLFWMVAWALQRICDQFGLKFFSVFLGILLTGAMLFTQKYNDLWRSPRRYCVYWLSQQPDQKIAHYWLAMDYFKTHEYEWAKDHFKQALNGSFVDWEVYSNLGVIALLERNWREAVLFSQNALRINPNAAEALTHLGTVAWKQGYLSEAADLFQRAVNADPSFTPARENLAIITGLNQTK